MRGGSKQCMIQYNTKKHYKIKQNDHSTPLVNIFKKQNII